MRLLRAPTTKPNDLFRQVIAAVLCAAALSVSGQATAQTVGPQPAQEQPDRPAVTPEAGEMDGATPPAGPSARGKGLQQIEGELAEIEQALGRITEAELSPEAPEALLERLRTTAAERRAQARRLADRLAEALRPARAEQETLGPAPEDGVEDPELARQREAVATRLAGIEALARKAELFVTRADGFIDEINRTGAERFSRELLTTGPSPLSPAAWATAAEDAYGFAARVVSEASENWSDPEKTELRRDRLPLIALGLAIALLVGVTARRSLIGHITLWSRPEASRRQRVAGGALIALLRVFMPLIALAAVVVALSESALFGPAGEALLEAFVVGAALLIGAQGLARAYYNPEAPHLRLSSLEPQQAARAATLAIFLGFVAFADHLVVGVSERLGLRPEAIAVYNFCIMTPGALALLLFAGALAPARRETGARRGEDDEETVDESIGAPLLRFAALSLIILSALAIILSAAGYFAATHYVFYGALLSVGLIALAVALYTLLQGAVDAYLAETEGEGGSSLSLAPIVVGFVISLGLAPLLAMVWGAGFADLEEAWFVIVNGVELGETRFAPGDLIKFVLAFLVVVTLTRILQAVLRRSVLPKVAIDRGAATALTSGLGYLGLALAFFVSISVAGIDLSSLAIVAGALSVGIGFGLQNIVSNFVSGIILLVERPFKVGDWISVGDEQGYVRKISVRATEIETFDRSSLIVPNSDFISKPMVNYTHGNNRGRVIVSVGVAYGCDTARVLEILREIAQTHPQAHRLYPPLALFRSFGDSALNFELRVIIRDVNQTLTVTSELNLAVDQRFREAGIDIPFPQRVVHMQQPGPVREPVVSPAESLN